MQKHRHSPFDFRASELKEELNRLGLPSTGSRQQLEERLMQHYETAQDAQYEALAAQVGHSSLLRASAVLMQSMCLLLLCYACCYTLLCLTQADEPAAWPSELGRGIPDTSLCDA